MLGTHNKKRDISKESYNPIIMDRENYFMCDECLHWKEGSHYGSCDTFTCNNYEKRNQRLGRIHEPYPANY